MAFVFELPTAIPKEETYETFKKIFKHISASLFYTNQFRLCKILYPVFSKLNISPYCYHHAEIFLLLTTIKQKINHFKCYPSMQCCHFQRLIGWYEHYLRTMKLSSRGEKSDSFQEENQEQNLWVDSYLREKHYSFHESHGKINVHEQIIRIQQRDYTLPDPQNVCCSPYLYKDWPITHSGLNTMPLILLSGRERKEVQNAVCALMNSKRGGVILFGFKTFKGEHGRIKPKLKDLLPKYRPEENQQKFKIKLQNILDRLCYKSDGMEIKYKIDFIPYKVNPHKYREDQIPTLGYVPRLVICPSTQPFYLKLQKELGKFQYEFYRPVALDYNFSEEKRVQGEEIYKQFCQKQPQKYINYHLDSHENFKY